MPCVHCTTRGVVGTGDGEVGKGVGDGEGSPDGCGVGCSSKKEQRNASSVSLEIMQLLGR